MLNKEALMLAGSKPVMGWIVEVTNIGLGWGAIAGSAGQITAFGGAPELTLIAAGNVSTGISPELPNGSKLRRADTGQIFTIGENFSLFTKADSGKTITVYYIPA